MEKCEDTDMTLQMRTDLFDKGTLWFLDNAR